MSSMTKMTGTRMELGGGGRFSALKQKLAGEKGVRNPGAVAAAIGRKKYGKSRFQALAAAGEQREGED